VITGHTDDVPIRTARFPSNWELSTERARSVVALMSSRLREPGRLRAEGVADSEPVAPNDSAANRAKNRRVTILLRSAS
jgi:type VI secretion system protein ImpK